MIYLDDLNDDELLRSVMALRVIGERAVTTNASAARSWAALMNECTRRAQDRGLFSEATGNLTPKGQRALRDPSGFSV